MRLTPFWTTYISTSKLGIPGLVSFCDTILLVLQAWDVLDSGAEGPRFKSQPKLKLGDL